MKCQTRDFGEVSYNEEDVINFLQPPFGFESYKNYIILIDSEVQDSICWLQSIDDSNLCFILINTISIYNPIITPEVTKKIGPGKTTIFGVCVITEDFKKSTVNLKSPIIINDETRKAMQIILSENYKVKHPLFETEI